MVFRRLPTYFPNFPLKLIPLTEAQQKIYEKTGFLRELAFRTIPSVNKVRSWARVQVVAVLTPQGGPPPRLCTLSGATTNRSPHPACYNIYE